MIFNRSKPLKVGEKFNCFTVLEMLNEKNKDGSWLYNCLCVCGNHKKTTRTDLVCNRKKSCGCGQVRAKQKEPGHTSYMVLFGSYKSRARKDNREFDLTFEKFKEIIIQNCYYCNEPPKKYNTYVDDGNKCRKINQGSIDRAWINANGIDRVDPKKGYILSNCVPCCAPCNYAKSDYTKEEFLENTRRRHEFQKSKNDQQNSSTSS